MMAVRGFWLVLASATCPVAWTQPPSGTESASLPPSFEGRVIYYNSFDSEAAAPEINTANAEQRSQMTGRAPGIRGQCAVPEGDETLQLFGDAFSPHRPLTVSFWWALQQDGQPESVFTLLTLTNGRGFVQHFSRGKGDWCALQRPAAVLQVYYLPGIPNINGIYDDDLAAHLDLRAGVWHHCALVFNGASLILVYTDGREAWRVRIAGRRFREQDSLRQLILGDMWGGLGVVLDEVLILNRALTGEEIATYYIAVRQMAAVGYP
jgi:hypothetical protein